MGSPRLRDLIGVIEIVGRHKSDAWLDGEIARWYCLAGEEVRRPAADLETARAEREIGTGVQVGENTATCASSRIGRGSREYP